LGVRLDSGDFLSLSRQVRSVLNEAGLDYVRIVVSGGLDEYEIIRLLRDQAPIDIFGVGTKAGVSADAPWSDMAYKLVCYDGRPVMKLSTDKASWPGAKQVFRVTGPSEIHSHDIVGLDDDLDGGEPLLSPVMEKGTRTRPNPALMEIRDQFNQDFDKLEDRYKALADSPEYPVKVSPRLDRLINEVRGGLLRSL
jgi:nicotinate phosphoribosyltransferase